MRQKRNCVASLVTHTRTHTRPSFAPLVIAWRKEAPLLSAVCAAPPHQSPSPSMPKTQGRPSLHTRGHSWVHPGGYSTCRTPTRERGRKFRVSQSIADDFSNEIYSHINRCSLQCAVCNSVQYAVCAFDDTIVPVWLFIPNCNCFFTVWPAQL